MLNASPPLEDKPVIGESILSDLYELIELRKSCSPEQSYSSKMLSKGRDKIAQKIGEEATELVIEAVKRDHDKIISESADLLYHICLLWVDQGITIQEIATCLASRRTQSGLDEKKLRKLT